MNLSAEGPEPQQRWKLPLHAGQTYILGRDHPGPLIVPWDRQISRQHAELVLRDGILHVDLLPDARNRLFYNGQEVSSCQVRRGEHFVIGSTLFELNSVESGLFTPAVPVGEVTFSRQSLQGVRFRDPDRRIEVLSHLPEVISQAQSDSEFFLRLVNLLLAGVTQAEAAAVVAWENNAPRVLHWDRRRETAGELRTSARLIREAIHTRQQSVLHVWENSEESIQEFTVTHEFDWAFCTPVSGPATQGWGLYLAGKRDRIHPWEHLVESEAGPLQADVKFTELMAEIVASVRRLRQLERQQAGLRQFFAPTVLKAVGENLDTGILAPREADVAILFCDLRGFSKHAEIARDDLVGLLDRVSQAMGIMTRHILEHGGGIGDLLGDSAMGFWGWPVSSPHAALDACRAALGIRQEFAAMQTRRDHPLANFQMGIGIAFGRAVAGMIGTGDHVKITVFGPAVNLASRLEGMTKPLRVPIVLDEAVAEMVQHHLSPTEARTRPLARVTPYGMERPLTVSELLPPADEGTDLSDAQLAAYRQAVDCFIRGDWEDAYRALHTLPASDRAQDFLRV
ncbi:MAG TPA: adenylate/guanylate cyclase domain-containing protein, partial [Planctomycetaceae bacterium]|nr:adenylate/guanylate cyclase domain-containing protein [Planctomycetaceae bacterium]